MESIHEKDQITLKAPVGDVPAGHAGTILIVWIGGESVEVEFFTRGGPRILTVPRANVQKRHQAPSQARECDARGGA